MEFISCVAKKLWNLYPVLLNSFWKDAILDWKQLLLGPILSLSTIWTKTTFARTDTFKRIDALILVALVASPLGQCELNKNKHFYFASLLLPISENTDEHSKFWHNKKRKIVPLCYCKLDLWKRGWAVTDHPMELGFLKIEQEI